MQQALFRDRSEEMYASDTCIHASDLYRTDFELFFIFLKQNPIASEVLLQIFTWFLQVVVFN